MILSYKYRLYPTKSQRLLIDGQLIEACRLYNAALEHRKEVYRLTKKSITYVQQSGELKIIRSEGLNKLANFSCSQDVLRRLDKTFKAFFGRIKRGDTPGFPRFKSSKRYSTLTFPSYNDGCKLNGQRAYFQGIGEVAVRMHRPLEGMIKTMSLTKKNDRYYVCFASELNGIIQTTLKVDKAIGIDVGIESLVVTSDGDFIDNPTWLKESLKKIARLSRSVARKKKGGKSRKKAVKILARHHEQVANQRRDYLSKVSTKLIRENDLIAIEDLNIKGLSAGMLARQVNDASWGILFNMLSYKAENAGKMVVKVDPRGTSQRCYACGNIVKKKLSERIHRCGCGADLHRDANSAKEILRLGLSLYEQTYGNSQSVSYKAA